MMMMMMMTMTSVFMKSGLNKQRLKHPVGIGWCDMSIFWALGAGSKSPGTVVDERCM